MNKCLSIKGAEDVLNKPHAFEISTTEDSMFFIAETVKVQLSQVPEYLGCTQDCRLDAQFHFGVHAALFCDFVARLGDCCTVDEL